MPTASAHNLNASVVYVFFDPDTQAYLDGLIADEPRPVGHAAAAARRRAGPDHQGRARRGHHDRRRRLHHLLRAQRPAGDDAAYSMPGDLTRRRHHRLRQGADEGPGADAHRGRGRRPDGQPGWASPAAPISWASRSPIVTPGNLNLGTLPGVYGDTGIFYSTAPETAFGTYTRRQHSPTTAATRWACARC